MSRHDFAGLAPRLPIDLNLDAGESEIAFQNGLEEALYCEVTSINIACGGHAGNFETMARAICLAKGKGLAIGAHPSFPDRENFGRARMNLSVAELVNSLKAQIISLREIARVHDVELKHVKPHGALYNLCADDAALAHAVIEAVSSTLPHASIVGLAGSRFLELVKENKITSIAEAFVDRRYEADATLRPRSLPGSMIDEPSEAAKQAVAIARHEPIVTYSGQLILLNAQANIQTLCIHGDSLRSLEVARAVRAALLA